MDPSEILELVKEGRIDLDQIEEFENLDEDLQEAVADGEADLEDF